MYSLVLMAALSTAGPTAPGWNGHSFGCNGGTYLHSGQPANYGAYSMGGCCGGFAYGSGATGCYGSCYGACYGQYAGGYNAGGGCYGAYNNCYGYGCAGGWGPSSASYISGGSVATSGYAIYGGSACYGGCYGCYGNAWIHHFHKEKHPVDAPARPAVGPLSGYPLSGVNVWGAAISPDASPYSGANNAMVAPPKKDEPKKDDIKKEDKPASARLMIETPADAKLYIDEHPVDVAQGKRSYVTPALQPGVCYYYIVRVDATKDGKPTSETRKVLIKAGEELKEVFTNDTATVLTSR